MICLNCLAYRSYYQIGFFGIAKAMQYLFRHEVTK